jgi:hypothetical protein
MLLPLFVFFNSIYCIQYTVNGYSQEIFKDFLFLFYKVAFRHVTVLSIGNMEILLL